MQRVFDIFFSGLSLLILSPIFLIIIIVLSFTGEKEIFFKQSRIGKNKEKFNLLKFATMMKNSEKLGSGSITLNNDFRVLPFGKFLRKTKINELPQLINVFIGQMSIIGPRPLHKQQFSFYNEKDQVIISSVRPGLSGVGSIIFRDEEKIFKNNKIEPDILYREKITPLKAKAEKWYIKNQSLYLYFKLIFFTFIIVIMPSINVSKYFKLN